MHTSLPSHDRGTENPYSRPQCVSNDLIPALKLDPPLILQTRYYAALAAFISVVLTCLNFISAGDLGTFPHLSKSTQT